ncbi:nitroreductase family protein [Fusobacterium mortiferum]|uniref:nitroreductase family protein n=1 Tax=Fusobacterium mortiferum TaxID=850 RepID=UPI00195AFB1B|nr:nitroreductase family protein [Fusobacterium mortiferum]
MDFLTRRSIRKYQDRKVEKEVIEQLMKTAVVSPSGRNGRPYEFVVVDDKEIIKKLAHSKESGAQFAENAPLMIVTLYHEYPTGEDDACIASTIIQLKAHELGLGSCWLQTKGKIGTNGKTCHENIREILNIPEDIHISNMISLGYPAEERPAYTEKDMDMTKVHFNKW